MTFSAPLTERRSGVDRRRRRVSIVVPERRTGFDRRAEPGRWSRLVGALRDAPAAVALVAIGFFLLNLADLVLTHRALAAGAIELNPVMAAALAAGAPTALGVKLAVGVVVAGGIWFGRRYRTVLAASVIVTAAMGLVVGYEVWMLLAV